MEDEKRFIVSFDVDGGSVQKVNISETRWLQVKDTVLNESIIHEFTPYDTCGYGTVIIFMKHVRCVRSEEDMRGKYKYIDPVYCYVCRNRNSRTNDSVPLKE